VCGILGVVNLSKGLTVDESRFRSAVQTMHHRGPDAQNVRRFRDDAIFAHSRLSIIDLSEANNQPFGILDRYWIVYNGEVFNYKELREELTQLGAQFRTAGDTEVVLFAYAFWGPDCVTRFNGMWAFAIYDAQERSVFCSRDRFGEKPFYYAEVNGEFIFASEPQAILHIYPQLAAPDYNVIGNFCRTSVGAQHSQTWFRDIKRLQPAGNLLITNSRIATTRYWSYPADAQKGPSFPEACEIYKSMFLDAVSLRMRSDVAVGITLSGGLDSTSIAYAAAHLGYSNLHCFTASFDPADDLAASGEVYANADFAIDESPTAKKVADELGFRSHRVVTNYRDFVPTLSRCVYHMGSGNSSSAVIPLFQLFSQARQDVTVILEGQGADELMAGYVANILWPAVIDLARRGDISEAIRSLAEFSETYKLSYAVKLGLRDLSNEVQALSSAHQRYSGLGQVYGPMLRQYSRLKDFPELSEPESASFVSRALRRSHSGGLANLLHYGDGISMANSLESRMPFMDHRLVEFVHALPAEYKFHRGIGKRLLREAMKGLVPEAILQSKRKIGFSTPLSQLFGSGDRFEESPAEVLLSRRCLDRDLFDKKGLQRLLHTHRAGQRDYSPLLFRLLSVELWFRLFIDGDATQLFGGRTVSHTYRV